MTNTKSKVDFSVIVDSKDQSSKALKLKASGKAFADNFNQFVKASLLFWNSDGARNIQIVNDLIVIAYETRGMNASKLMDYCYAAGVIHKSVEIEKSKPKQYRFGGKDKSKEYKTNDEMKEFLAANPTWSSFYEDAAPKYATIELEKVKTGFLIQVARGLAAGTVTADEVKAFAEQLLNEATAKTTEDKVVSWVERYKELHSKAA